METQTRDEKRAAIATLIKERATLVDRLDTGAKRIEDARAKGKDVTTWEGQYARLMAKYEWTCDAIRDAQAEL